MLFFLVSVIFVFGISILWSKNWLIEENPEYYPVFLSKAALEKKVDEQRNERKENLKKTLEIYDDQNNKK